jgi:hypothetical protein
MPEKEKRSRQAWCPALEVSPLGQGNLKTGYRNPCVYPPPPLLNCHRTRTFSCSSNIVHLLGFDLQSKTAIFSSENVKLEKW